MMISKITKMFDELIEIYQKFSYEILFNIFKSFQIVKHEMLHLRREIHD